MPDATATPSLMNTALGYAARGWRVFPCKADKTPMTRQGFKDASTDPEQVRELEFRRGSGGRAGGK